MRFCFTYYVTCTYVQTVNDCVWVVTVKLLPAKYFVNFQLICQLKCDQLNQTPALVAWYPATRSMWLATNIPANLNLEPPHPVVSR